MFIMKIGGLAIILVWISSINASEKKTELTMLVNKNKQSEQSGSPRMKRKEPPLQQRELVEYYLKLGLAGIGCKPDKDKTHLIEEFLVIKQIIDTKYKGFIDHPSFLNISDIYNNIKKSAEKTPEGERYATIRLKNKQLAVSLASGEKVPAQDKEEVEELLMQRYMESFERRNQLSENAQSFKTQFQRVYQDASQAFERNNFVQAHNNIKEAYELALDTVFCLVEHKGEIKGIENMNELLRNYINKHSKQEESKS